MKYNLFHGSVAVIENPVYGFGKKDNDYGLGFYCTENRELAAEWASMKEGINGFVNSYELEVQDLSVLHLNSEEFTILHWINLLIQNRRVRNLSPLALQAKDYLMENFAFDYSSADILIGYRADDSYFSFARDFLSGAIPYRKLARAIRLGKLGEQVVLKSQKAFDRLVFLGAEKIENKEYFEKWKQRDLNAREEYFDAIKTENRIQKGDIFIQNILTEEIKADDPRLQ